MENGFGKILKELRIEKGVSQPALAESIGVSQGMISLWENNLSEPKLSFLIALAKYFGVSMDYFVG